ncbi:5-oxoprolinase subunit PxpB [bacterium]|nr:5-oxoprolinase subunit PxpB [bacterium]
MTNPLERIPRLSAVGESAVLIEFGKLLDPAVNDRVRVLDRWSAADTLPGVLSWVPGYISLLVYFDPLICTDEAVRAWLLARWESCPQDEPGQAKRVQIPVHYGGEDGPDLEFVAKLHRLSPAEVIRRHTAPIYRVGMMGFTPGFAYLLGLDPGLETPRLANPRTRVPAGSVGIAGGQTGVYPLESPGGWQLIGRTTLALFDPAREEPFLLAPGDEVRFVIAPERGRG